MPNSNNVENTQPARVTTVLLALFVVFLWATSWVLIKMGLQEIPALTFAGLRYGLAFLFLLPFAMRIQRRPSAVRLTRQMWGQLIILGLLLYALTQGAVFLALAYLPAVTTNLLWSFSTVVVALFGVVWLAEHPTRFQWSGIVLATLGALIYFYPVSLPQGYQVGLAVSVIGVLANAGSVIFGRKINRARELHPLLVTAASMGIGALVLLTAGIAMQGLPSIGLTSWVIIAWLALVNTAVAFTLWNYTLQTLSATESSIINGTMLIWIPILAVVFLDERVTGKELLGLIAAGIGTLIVQLRSPATFQRIIRGRR
ncbi:MAG: DMT family transporter [Anaerolineales bacterium]|jgi:drug/metabolite transporter (DMT)-like permease